MAGNFDRVRFACEKLGEAGVEVSLFIDPEARQIEAAARAGAPVVELHTGQYAEAASAAARDSELQRLRVAAALAQDAGLIVNAGHGLHYHNVDAVSRIPQIRELNIGHAIVARALFSGLARAVADMKGIMTAARGSIDR